MFDAIIGMATGTLFVTYFFMIPFLILLYSFAEKWVQNVTKYEHHLSQKPYKMYDKFYNGFFNGAVWFINGTFLIFGNIVFLISKYQAQDFQGTYLEWCIIVLFEFPAKVGAWASEVVLIIILYFISTWAAKWIYSLASRINKLEKKDRAEK